MDTEPNLDRFAGHPLPMDEVLADVASGDNLDLAHSRTLPPEAYTSRDFFKREIETIFKKEWIALGHTGQIPNVGDYFTIDMLGELLVVVRGPDRIRVMSRVCLHRWAPVASGKGNTKMFSCPFHRWGYGLDGQLRTAPHMEQVADFDINACKLPEARSEIVNGTIYVNFSGTAAPLGERVVGFSKAMEPYRMKDLALGYSMEFTCNFNWKIAVETFMECYHHIGAHAKTLQAKHPGGLSWGEDAKDGWIAVHQPLRPDLPTEENMMSGLPPFPELPDELRRDSGLYLVFPFNLVGTHADCIHWTTLIPRSATETTWVRHVLVLPEALDLPNFDQIIERKRKIGSEIAAEDLEVNGMQQIGAQSSLATVGRLSHLEKPVWQLANYVRSHVLA